MVKRQPTKISVEGINFKKPTGDVTNVKRGVKETGAWRYPGGVIQRAPDTWLGSKHYYDDKDPGEARRKHESNFFITLNTNKKVGGEMEGKIAQHGKLAMKQTLDDLSKEEFMCSYIKFGPKSKEYREDVFADVITKIEWQAAVEVGENLERLHCHIWLTVHHYSQVQINMPVMQKLFKDAYNARIDWAHASELRVKGMPYIQVKLLPTSDWAMVMKQYMHKAMTFSEVE